MRLRVQCLKFRVEGLGVLGLEVGFQILVFGVWSLRFGVYGLGFRV